MGEGGWGSGQKGNWNHSVGQQGQRQDREGIPGEMPKPRDRQRGKGEETQF